MHDADRLVRVDHDQLRLLHAVEQLKRLARELIRPDGLWPARHHVFDARIEQDAFISQQLSLWGQRGQVIRGSLLAIPIETSLLYVQPLYLAAEKGSLPELKRVIVAFGNQIAMEENLEQSLQRIFGGKPAPGPVLQPAVAGPQALTTEKELARQALTHFQRSQELLRQGNWAGYGDELKKVEDLLREMQKGR